MEMVIQLKTCAMNSVEDARARRISLCRRTREVFAEVELVQCLLIDGSVRRWTRSSLSRSQNKRKTIKP